MVSNLNNNITIVDKNRKCHLKAEEEYLHVRFNYPGQVWDGWIPVEYRRTGVSLKTTDEEYAYLNEVYEQMKPENVEVWKEEQREFWSNRNAKVTKSFFDSLVKGGWQCVDCTLPKNLNWARRIQDLKELGYTIATDTKRRCPKCNAPKTHILLLPIKRCPLKGNGYEKWSSKLRERILSVLGNVDVYENKLSRYCLPDHKFSEIRWDENTKEENPDDMSDEDIRSKFQLLTNQRNQQKRECCKNCYHTGIRGYPFGIKFFYKGTEKWDDKFPKRGKEVEKGCIGCGWYDLEEWRRQLLLKLKNSN